MGSEKKNASRFFNATRRSYLEHVSKMRKKFGTEQKSAAAAVALKADQLAAQVASTKAKVMAKRHADFLIAEERRQLEKEEHLRTMKARFDSRAVTRNAYEAKKRVAKIALMSSMVQQSSKWTAVVTDEKKFSDKFGPGKFAFDDEFDFDQYAIERHEDYLNYGEYGKPWEPVTKYGSIPSAKETRSDIPNPTSWLKQLEKMRPTALDSVYTTAFDNGGRNKTRE